MKYYLNLQDKKIKCLLCQHYCKLKDGQTGICGVNKNQNNKLQTLVYGHPTALNLDPIEKKPMYHVLPNSTALSFGTVGCNFQCPFCQNWEISQEKNINKKIKVTPKQMVDLAIQNGAKSIAYTYNEPTIFYPYAKDIGVIARDIGIRNIFVTNGFESKEVVSDMKTWLDGANVDLKSWDERYYKKILKGGLEVVKQTLKNMVSLGIWVEITTLIIEGENDNDKDLKAMADFIAHELGRHVPWHLSAFHPDYKMREHQTTSNKTIKKAYNIAKDAGLWYVYLGNTNMHTDTICPKCGTILIQRNGYGTNAINITDGTCPKCNRKIEGIWR
ncbi:MAG: AmmeMemoRadiSam system radical SAM enzyme [Epsilonproteobacteria bacterium]|nr:AmmeMemoRadiSam system radical SAM enzyme [Campylobacterota bacterium]